MAGRRGASLRSAGTATRRRPAAGPSRPDGSRPRRGDLRSNGAGHRQLRGLCRSDDLYLEIRCRARRQGAVHAARARGLRFVSRQSAMQRLPSRRRPRRGSAVHRFHRQQYRRPCQSTAALLCREYCRRAGLYRQYGRTIVRRWRRRQLPHQGASAEPAVGGGCTMGQVRAGQPGALSGADAAQRGQAAISRLREGLWTQWILHQLEIDRSFLQHARCPAPLSGQRSRRRHNVLARAGIDRQHQHQTRRAAGPFGRRGRCTGEFPADADGRLHASRSARATAPN